MNLISERKNIFKEIQHEDGKDIEAAILQREHLWNKKWILEKMEFIILIKKLLKARIKQKYLINNSNFIIKWNYVYTCSIRVSPMVSFHIITDERWSDQCCSWEGRVRGYGFVGSGRSPEESINRMALGLRSDSKEKINFY